jgi:hypothetical protein
VNNTINSTAPAGAAEHLSLMRTSEILRGILTKNPGVTTFSVERILDAIGTHRFEASLMMFSIPGIVPVPGPRGIVAMPTGAIAWQMVSGQKHIRLPRFLLKKCVSRKSLAVAIHAILPILEAAEKLVRPRWSWVSHPISRRAIGLFIFLMAIAIGQPVFGFNALHAMSICVISLGMSEHDGLAVMLGVVAGVLSLAILAGSGLSARAVRAKLGKALRKIARRLGFTALAKFLDELGYKRLASIVSLEWSELLLIWDPEKRTAERTYVKVQVQPVQQRRRSNGSPRAAASRERLVADAPRQPVCLSVV